MINQKNKIKLIIFTVVAVAMVVIIFLTFKDKKVLPEQSFFGIGENNFQAGGDFENSVTVETDDGTINKIDLVGGKIIEPASAEKEDFSDFSGFPKINDENAGNFQQSVLMSKNKKRAIVTVMQYTASGGGSLENEQQMLLNSEDYMCDFEKKSCQRSDVLTQSYQGLDEKIQKDFNSFTWNAWDSVNGLLFGNLFLGEVGDVSPIYICNIELKSCSITAGFDSQKAEDVSAVVPAGSLSPMLGKFVLISQHDKPNEETGDRWELLLFDTKDLPNPKSYDISVIIDRDENVAYDRVYSIAWSADEKKIAIGTARRIFMFDVESGGLSLVYIAPEDGEGDFYWDSSKLFLSPDASMIAFVDTKDILTESGDELEEDSFDETIEDTDISLNVLKKIDLKNSNVVTELLQGEGLSLK